MEIELEELKEIAAEYFDIDDEVIYTNNWNDFIYCYNKLKNCPCVKAKDSGSLIDALYFVASDIASNEFFKTTKDSYGNTFSNYIHKCKPLDYIISVALYRVYDDAAISSMSDDFIKEKKLKR